MHSGAKRLKNQKIGSKRFLGVPKGAPFFMSVNDFCFFVDAYKKM